MLAESAEHPSLASFLCHLTRFERVHYVFGLDPLDASIGMGLGIPVGIDMNYLHNMISFE